MYILLGVLFLATAKRLYDSGRRRREAGYPDAAKFSMP